ncbi:MAG: 2-C-methyl-D-erythritol 4-phosphate cytidylyltransferase [Alphaproteobacteria bacterium]|nr:2-C-methyl-D-erythritol 4-phosphate cytidylyltransferase [Alphaproteobacteria bacterium]
MELTQRLHVLVPAAGSGSRAGTSKPKQYQALAGMPLVVHTLKAMALIQGLDSLNVVVSPGDNQMGGVLQCHPSLSQVRVWPVGGETRAASVGAGLQALLDHGAAPGDWVLVHDAARCLIQAPWVEELIRCCRDDAVGGLLALPLPDTLKQADATLRVRATLERTDKWLAQTPQMFRLGLLQNALKHAGSSVTDEASAIEAQGLQPLLVRGNALNFKVTYPEDLLLAQCVLQARSQENPA